MTQPIHSQGFTLVTSVRDRNPENLPKPTDECKVTWRSFFRRKYACGHRDSRRFRLSVCDLTSKTISQKDKCAQCMIEYYKQHIIFCALCGLPIVPGDAIALYDEDNEGIRENATHINGSVLGCMRWDCCPAGGFFAGNWSTEGFKPYPF